MKKTIITKISIVALVLVMMVSVLAACNLIDGDDPVTPPVDEHQHTFDGGWTKDADYHWHAATCEHVTELSGKARHSFDAGVVNSDETEKVYTCSVCGYTKTEILQKVQATVKQAKVNLGTFKINIPDGTKYLGITTTKGQARAAADSDGPEVSQFLSAFSEVGELINKTITFSQIRKVFLTHEMIDIFTERTETIVTNKPVYEMVEDPETGELVTKVDESGNPIQKVDENGDLVFETESRVVREKVGQEYKVLYTFGGQYAIHETVNDVKVYYSADANSEAVLVDGERVAIELPEDYDWQYIYEKDEAGNVIPRTERVDDVVDYVYADTISEDELDPKEQLLEVTIEKTQGDFALDIIKLKVVNNFAFICFALPVPEECYNGGVYTIQEADGTITTFTVADLPERKTEANASYYDDVKYYTNKFVQSYVLDINTEKIYPMVSGKTAIDIEKIDEFGFITVGDQIYEVRLSEGNTDTLSLRKITEIINDDIMETVNTYKDKNGIVYIQSKVEKDVRIIYNRVVDIYFVYYPYTNLNYTEWLTPYIFFDTSNNAYIISDNQLKMITGIETTESSHKFILSETDYSRGTEKLNIRSFSNDKIDDGIKDIFFYDGRMFMLVKNGSNSAAKGLIYTVSNIADLAFGRHVKRTFFSYRNDCETFSSAVGYGTSVDNGYVYSFEYDNGLFYINTNKDKLQIIYIKHRSFISDDELSDWSLVDGTISDIYSNEYGRGYGTDIYYKKVQLTYNGENIVFDNLARVELSECNEEDRTIIVKITEKINDYGTKNVYYFGLDLQEELPKIVECYSNKSDATIKKVKRDTSYIITIAPIN